ncbi:hypothetical protein JVT61DRAFT_10446 [Boletus reticuloceps]|uniref:Uncharacterized protein n=1 Tax=Boletus reticuloceps TaxID=495285 RepID=A0A8I2YUX5_9AGAM|nr:hypothetical protein JVT61DRAFT_10446 [Boletus reticuloceps]
MLLHSSPLSLTCSTPSRSSYCSARSHQPVNSSPLASPTYSSPTHGIQQRRRAQYKSMTPGSYCSPVTRASAKLPFRTGNQTPEEPQKVFLRERLQARCREHAQQLRKRTVNSRRSSDMFSDVFMDCDDDEEESDDVIMQDELFRRIIQNTNRKKEHSYRVSYAFEVGSSFDPDMEDPSAWENELRGKSRRPTCCVNLVAFLDQKSSSTEPSPEDFEEEFLEYAEKCAAFADFADLDLEADDSDIEELQSEAPRGTGQPRDMCPISDMDMS